MVGGFENKLIEKMSREPNKHDGNYYTGIEKFDKRIVDQWHQSRVKYKDFLGLYDKENINEDIKYVRSIRNSDTYVKDRDPAATALEYMVMEGVYSDEWFGEGYGVIPTLEHDDVVNGIDMVVSFDGEGGERSHLGIDVTVSSDEDVVEKKIKRTIRDLRKGKLSEVKYFCDDDEPNDKGMREMPRVVVNLDISAVRQVLNDFKLKEKPSINKEFGKYISSEILVQLAFFTHVVLIDKLGEYSQPSTVEEIINFIKENEDLIEAKGLNQLRVFVKLRESLSIFEKIDKKNTPNSTSLTTSSIEGIQDSLLNQFTSLCALL